MRRPALGTAACGVLLALVGGLGPTAAGATETTQPVAESPTIGADFDGDGYADLAIGVPGESTVGVRRNGAVNVLYGSSDGITAARNQIWHAGSPGMAGLPPRKRTQLGARLAVGDLNGDGRSDLAISVQYDRVAGLNQAGALRILYGSPTGLTTDDDQYLTAPSPSYEGRFTRRMAAGDLNGDGYDDLALTDSPFFSLPTTYVLYGGPDGMDLDRRTDVPMPDRTDSALVEVAVEDFDGDGVDDLALGSPERGGSRGIGFVDLLYGSSEGIDPTARQTWSQDKAGVLGIGGDAEQFGSKLAAGDVNGDGFADLAVFTLADGIGEGVARHGSVAVLLGSAGGLVAAGDVLWALADLVVDHVPDLDELADLGIGDLNADGSAELAVGAPGATALNELGEPDERAGAIVLVPGSPAGLVLAERTAWTENEPGWPNLSELGDEFGTAPGFGDFDGDGFLDLRTSAPGEQAREGASDSGAVYVIAGSAAGLDPSRVSFWHQDSRGVKDRAGGAEAFGTSLG